MEVVSSNYSAALLYQSTQEVFLADRQPFSSIIARNKLSSRTKSARGESYSAIHLLSSTNTWSLTIIVLNLCAMVRALALPKFLLIILWMTESVTLSMLAVASSNTVIFGLRSNDGAIHKIASGLEKTSLRHLCLKAWEQCSYDFRHLYFPGNIPELCVRQMVQQIQFLSNWIWEKTGTCWMMEKFDGKVKDPLSAMSALSITVVLPSFSISDMQNNATMKVLLPDPVRPETPSFSPALTRKDTFLFWQGGRCNIALICETARYRIGQATFLD